MDERTCSTPGCDREAIYRTRKLCKRCYNRAIAPTPTRTSPRTPDPIRFERNIAPAANGCWVWTAKTNGNGYGVMNCQGRISAYAHRWSYEYHRAPIPDGLQIDHLCRNTLCVNPWHLEPVTPKVNVGRSGPAQRTHCPQGHEYTPENTYRPPATGWRICRKCNAEKSSRRFRPPAPRSEFCKNGHPLSGENLVEKSGIRVCRACRSLAAQASNRKRWGYEPKA